MLTSIFNRLGLSHGIVLLEPVVIYTVLS